MSEPRLPRLVAFDFDGVLCDTAREAFRSAWAVCRDLKLVDGAPPPDLGAAFLRMRPVAEFGYEFPVLLLALKEGAPEPELERSFQSVWRPRILERYGLTRPQLTAGLDTARDRAIREDLDGWLSEQGLYPGVAERLRAILADGLLAYVITTKGGRFAQKLLEIHGVAFPADRVWGKEQGRPKAALLRSLIQTYGLRPAEVWFVEDRLQTLRAVEREPDLQEVGLIFATWGYTLSDERLAAAVDPRIVPITLAEFARGFEAWRRR